MNGIFLGYTERDAQERRTDLFQVLLKAGLQAFPSNVNYNSDSFSYITGDIEKAECAVLCLGNTYGAVINGLDLSIAHYEYIECRKKCSTNSDFKLFVWHPAICESYDYDERQADLLAEIRNDISANVSLITVNYPIQLVSDLRASLKEEKAVQFDVKSTDVFLIYNQLDDYQADEIVDMLTDMVPIEKLNIIQDSDVDYSEYCSQQIGKSKLAVVYFKESADWALPFTQQIWKKIGGASSNTSILLIGDEDPESNQNKKFKAPKVASLIVAGELIPLEIKVHYDKIVEGVI